MKKRIIVLGSSGQLGSALVLALKHADFDCVPAGRAEADISDTEATNRFLYPLKPSVVINAAAYTAVDLAESEPEKAIAANTSGPAHLAAACQGMGIPLIHYSTDYVFDGTKPDAYSEADPVAPQGVYGRSKAEGEAKIRAILPRHIIIRTAWLYGLEGGNFVKTMLRKGKTERRLRVVDDQFGCPTFAGDLASATVRILDLLSIGPTEAWGTYHYCNGGWTSWHGFAVEIIRLAKQHRPNDFLCETVEPIPSSAYPTPARRPPNSVMDCSLVRRTFGLEIPSWRASLAKQIPDLISAL